ncbi:hypothetical protein [Maritimibacter dapengensis]|uniref:Uncharacterized protein n=1 Tax=Maritimibacter dapengensis TaxID=2836868 RepID=A0ABS6SXD1_9RHOB|nr:hypothetical protein [Maritimibacter dapengensis]MBV7377616.1 hypothetical protein [Maritimibacter dapengensis]
MKFKRAIFNKFGVPLLCGALIAGCGPGHAQTGLSETGRLIVGLSSGTELASAWDDNAAGGADVEAESEFAVALENLVGLPIHDIRLGSGRTVSFAPDWEEMGATVQGQTLRLGLGDPLLAAALAARLDPIARSDQGASLELDPQRSAAAIAGWLVNLEGVAFAQPDIVVDIRQ